MKNQGVFLMFLSGFNVYGQNRHCDDIICGELCIISDLKSDFTFENF